MKEDLIEKKTKEGFFMLSQDGKALFSLNEIGSFVWSAFKCNKTKDEIVKDLVSVYDVDEDQAEKDIKIFIKDLEKYSSELLIDSDRAILPHK